MARTTNIGLLHPNVRNNVGEDISIDVPQPKYWRGCVPGIPGGVDASGCIGLRSESERDKRRCQVKLLDEKQLFQVSI